MVNWVSHNSIHGRNGDAAGADYDDEIDDAMIEEADNNNYRAQRGTIQRRKVLKKTSEIAEEDFAKIDKERLDATIMGIEGSVTVWLNQERSKQNVFLRRKNLGVTDTKNDERKGQHYRWLRKPRFDQVAIPKPGEHVFFYDKIANADLVIALVPVFLVLILIMNLIV